MCQSEISRVSTARTFHVYLPLGEDGLHREQPVVLYALHLDHDNII